MIRFGVIGTNWITEKFLDAAAQTGELELTAVYSRTEDRASQFAEKHGARHTYTNLEKFAASKEFDAVYIASPNSLHAEQAILCINHGKHVLCEKPIASNAAEMKKMIEAARANEVLLMEAMKTTLLPNFTSIKKNLDKIGKIRRYVASYCQYSSRYDAYKEGKILNAFKPEFSNGSMMDIGIYCIAPMVALFGKPNSIQATAHLLESGVDGEGSILFQYEEHDAIVMFSKITDSYIPSEIQGEAGSIVIEKFSTMENVRIQFRTGESEDISVEQNENSMYGEAKEFSALIREGKLESSINTFENSLTVLEIMDEARRQIGLVYPADEKGL
ncbi:Gfo/Idh/MocA family oxidoreductase [Metabacillus sp. KIGAM252]|uniref:Gfo/Idh/MocA family oxidoreductase n=1 Tax=Metabacillus flavus TaxID=2823519 RepID=A0ABS5LJ84_9BACI|nr:Gfo/Idh/MocA family oxidoreductase [Metabacillus flavus]MBS2970824.1 Gfo/Idh/MocA family oxidoreductase [Metabacillus flavus]